MVRALTVVFNLYTVTGVTVDPIPLKSDLSQIRYAGECDPTLAKSIRTVIHLATPRSEFNNNTGFWKRMASPEKYIVHAVYFFLHVFVEQW